jgi:RimJ/RimL family protein N-acetyltransferase
VRSWLVAQLAQAGETGFCMWWWRDRATGELVGYAGLNITRLNGAATRLRPDGLRLGGDEVEGVPIVEVGWSITPDRWGEGLATEAARAAVAWGFQRTELEEVVAFTLLDNVRSRRVMEKLGMTYVRDFERAGLPHALYRLLRSAPR